MTTSTTGVEKEVKLAIVGGGIGGLCLAIGLHKQGVPFHIYEAAHHFGEIGAGVALHPCAQSAMKLIDTKLYEGFERHATFNKTIKDTWFRVLYGMDSKDGAKKAGDHLVDILSPGYGRNCIHRAEFLDELVKLVPQENVSFGKRLVREVDEGTQVRLEFNDGTSAIHSAVIGCDGIKSHVRESLLGPQYNAIFTGKYCYRGILPMEQARELLGDEMASNAYMHIGYGGHLLNFPIARGNTMNIVAFSSKPDGKWTDDRWVVPTQVAVAERDFEGWGSNVSKVISMMHDPDIWALFEAPPAPTYFRNRVALAGDAAHATTPHQGSGAGMAIEDAFILSSLLGIAKNNTAEIPLVFAVYDELRRVRSQRLVTTSNEAGLLWELENPSVGDDPEKFKENVHHRFNWIWNHDLEKELEQGKQLLAEREKDAAVLA